MFKQCSGRFTGSNPDRGWFVACFMKRRGWQFAARNTSMTPLLTINLLRALFVAFTLLVGTMIGDSFIGTEWGGSAIGLSFGLAVVLSDRLMRGISLRVFSSATVGLFIGIVFARLLLASHILARAHEDTQWLFSLIAYATFGYFGT